MHACMHACHKKVAFLLRVGMHAAAAVSCRGRQAGGTPHLRLLQRVAVPRQRPLGHPDLLLSLLVSAMQVHQHSGSQDATNSGIMPLMPNTGAAAAAPAAVAAAARQQHRQEQQPTLVMLSTSSPGAAEPSPRAALLASSSSAHAKAGARLFSTIKLSGMLALHCCRTRVQWKSAPPKLQTTKA